jgi:hypothetical protein
VTITITGPSLTSTPTTLTPLTTQPTAGDNFTLTATVVPSGAPGTVTFYNATTNPATVLGSGSLSGGTATLQTSFSTAGTYSITATYSGSITYSTSTTATPLSITVSQ